MALIINEEQQMLKTSAKEFLNEKAPITALRKLRDDKNPKGYDPILWSEMAAMGWAGLTIPEEYGGLGFGYTGLGQVLEQTGRTLTASPLVSTVLLGSTLVNLAGNKEQKEAILPAIAEGNLLLSLAMEESNAHRPFEAKTTYRKTTTGYSLNGYKKFVLDGNIADKFIITARKNSKSSLTLFLIDAQAKGVKVERKTMMDSRNIATVTLKNVKANKAAILGGEGKGERYLEKALDIARIGLSAEMLGAMQEAFERTIAYLKEREQFGVPIGVFQGLQHRAANMYCEIELCKSLVLKGLQTIDEDDVKSLALIASMVKAKVGEVLKLVTNEGIQMFGGIGMTDEEEIGFFMKRARVAQRTFGDASYHLDRFAHLSGF